MKEKMNKIGKLHLDHLFNFMHKVVCMLSCAVHACVHVHTHKHYQLRRPILKYTKFCEDLTSFGLDIEVRYLSKKM